MIKEISTRKSTRKYNSTPVEDEKIIQLIESARLAPSGSNTQPWNFIIVRSEDTKAKIAEINNNQKWMKGAPVFVVCVADIRCRIKENRDIYLDENTGLPELKQIIRDTAIAVEHILLETESIGLAGCWTAWFSQDSIRPIMNIPDDKYVVGVITIGYSDASGNGNPTSRRSLESMLRYEKW
ncbi:MAG: nitroreductase family protein [Defluviitaleaceae bacterium]|nr:nitroreductase family protein [Defluviitaleaceae bacterium]